MGVNGLWQMLSDVCERKPLTYLSGKKVAVDLSGWVVQAITCKGLNTSKCPHLRNLFFRISRLLHLGVNPIFVIEGKPPAVKERTLKERHFGNATVSEGVSRSVFDRTLSQCQDLINTLGVPCIKSSGEAEAFCAFLCLNGIVDGVVTEDNDAFLYGADVVYREFSIDAMDSHVNVYCLKSEKNKLNLDRKKLVALALLLGCDYTKGVPGIGKETAVKLLSELNCDDVLKRFEEWKNLSESELFPGLENEAVKKGTHCTRCGHQGSSSKHKKEGCSNCKSEITCYLPDADKPCKCPWHLRNELMSKRKTELKIYSSIKNISNFPDMEVVAEYLNFTDDIPREEVLKWNCPNLKKFQEKALYYLNWTFQYSQEKFLPLFTSWQQHKLAVDESDKSDFIYEPAEILKERSIRDVTHFDVKWKIIDSDLNSNLSDENLITTEYGDRFSTCYKELVTNFYHELDEQKKSKQKSKKFKSDVGNRKIDEFFAKTAHIKGVKRTKVRECLDNMDTSEK